MEHIGFHECSLAELVRDNKADKVALKSEHKDPGHIIIKTSEKKDATARIQLDLQPMKLPAQTNIWACNFSSTYYMEIYRGARGHNAKIYESRYFVDDPTARFELDFTDAQLFGCDAATKIEFKFVSRNQYKMTSTEVCYLECTIAELTEAATKKEDLVLLSPKGARPLASRLRVHSTKQTPIPAFADYLKSGHQVSLIGAVDFTFSNGPCNLSSSLHYLDPDDAKPNQYMQAIRAVGNILDQYDSDKKYPFYGFGAVPSGEQAEDAVSDCFALNEDETELEGVEAVIEAYKATAASCAYMGPTRFASVIRKAREQVEASGNPKMYYMLLILTDGEVHDLRETVHEIATIATKNLPMSIIIVGVGDEEFTNMVKLDGDDIAIKAGVKDIVQFVKFNEVLKRSQPDQAMATLAAMVLEEVPAQVVAHYSAKNMFP